MRKLNWFFSSYFFLNNLCISHKIWVGNTSSVHANFFLAYSAQFLLTTMVYQYVSSVSTYSFNYWYYNTLPYFCRDWNLYFTKKDRPLKKKEASTRTPTICPTLCVWTMMVTLWTIPQLISWNCRNLLLHPSHKLHLLQLHRTKNPVSRPNGTSTTGTFLISTILRAFQRQMKTKTELVRMVS